MANKETAVSTIEYSEPFPGVDSVLEILTGDELPPNWLVPDLALQGTMIALAGEPGAGKSYLSYTLAIALAGGVGALGGIVPEQAPKRVLYFDEENSRGDRDKYMRRSWTGLAKDGRFPDPNVVDRNLWPVSFKIGGEDWEEKATIFVQAHQPDVLFFDTATPCFNIQDENDNAEATAAIMGVHRLMAMSDPKATAVILKHAKMRVEKGQRRTIRGAKAWQSAVDMVLFQVKAQGRPRTDGLSLTKLLPDKVRAYGLQRPIYITPNYTDDERTGLVLNGSYAPNALERDED